MTIETLTMHLDDIVEVRDIMERIEEIESLKDDEGHLSHDEAHELKILADVMAKIKGYSRDEQWRGDWYPTTLINESHFEKAMDEMISGCYEVPEELPSFMKITIDYAALRKSYSPVEIDGVTFFYR